VTDSCLAGATNLPRTDSGNEELPDKIMPTSFHFGRTLVAATARLILFYTILRGRRKPENKFLFTNLQREFSVELVCAHVSATVSVVEFCSE
jgi:hypothetical protein